MIYIANKRCKEKTLRKKYGEDAIICDVTSKSDNKQLVRLSPFYPHGDVPVPFSDGITASCVEAIWQGLKVFQNSDVDVNLFANSSMRNIKRTVRSNGPVLGHRKGVNGTELLDYLSARKEIYLPTYRWVLENKVEDIMKRLKEAAKTKTIVLLDFTTNSDPFDTSKPLSHAFLIKAYVEGCYPDMISQRNNSNDAKQLLIWED